jgi:hypothetical protein
VAIRAISLRLRSGQRLNNGCAQIDAPDNGCSRPIQNAHTWLVALFTPLSLAFRIESRPT